MTKKPRYPELPVGPVIRTPEQSKQALRSKVRMFYDLQRLRLATGGRVQPKAEGADIQLAEYDKLLLERRFKELESAEKRALKDVTEHLKDIPFYVDKLSEKPRYKGVGPTMAGVILSEFDIHRSENPSQMWSFAGLAPLKAFRCKECHLVVESDEAMPGEFVHPTPQPRLPRKGVPAPKEPRKKCSVVGTTLNRSQVYDSGKTMRPVAKQKLPYNAFLRTKLCGVLGPVLLQAKSPWTKCYADYKQRWINQGKGMSDGHRHAAAIRYMIKMLLLDIWTEWRKAEGLPVRPSYQEEKLGHVHSRSISQAQASGEAIETSPEIQAELDNLDAA